MGRERRFGLITQQRANILMPLNIEQSKKDILHATKSRMNTVIGLKIPIVIKYQSKNARMCHIKIVMTCQKKSASKNPGKIVKIIQDKNAKMSIQRSPNR